MQCQQNLWNTGNLSPSIHASSQFTSIFNSLSVSRFNWYKRDFAHAHILCASTALVVFIYYCFRSFRNDFNFRCVCGLHWEHIYDYTSQHGAQQAVNTWNLIKGSTFDRQICAAIVGKGPTVNLIWFYCSSIIILLPFQCKVYTVQLPLYHVF